MNAPRTLNDPPWLRWGLTLVSLAFVALFLVLPLVNLFAGAFSRGWDAYWAAIADPYTRSAIGLTLLVAGIAVPLNVLFGLAAAWAIARFDFRGKNILITCIELPLAVSPVVAGLIFVLVLGAHGWLGPWLLDRGWRVIFGVPGIVIATMFVTLPYVARELIPLMQAQGAEEEEAALLLGAGGWRIFVQVTLPNIRWGLLYGVVLCTARALGEFGAVSVVSGHIRGETNTLPLHVELLYNEYRFAAAFAVASLLALFGLVTMAVKRLLERKRESGAARLLGEA